MAAPLGVGRRARERASSRVERVAQRLLFELPWIAREEEHCSKSTGRRQTADLLTTESNQEHPMTMDAKICFDENYKIKAIEPAKFVRAEELEKECGQFVEKISSFSDKVNALVEVLEANAARIDAQKLRAIGLRMAKDNEAEQRSRQQRALQAVINEKRAELDRYTAQFHSLERIENEQKLALEKLTSAQTEVARK